MATSGTTFTVSGTHTYTTAGQRHAHVTVTNIVNGVISTPVSNSSTATVLAAPTVSAQNITAFVGTSFSGQVATGTYSGQGTLSATIDWGDGTTPSVVTPTTSGTSFTVSGSHTYTTAGNDTLTVTVTNTANGVTSAPASSSSTATVLAAPTVMAQNIIAFAGASFSGQVASWHLFRVRERCLQ